MVTAFKTRYFARWARKVGIADSLLWRAVEEMRQGLIDADLGGGIVKKRLPLPGRGKRAGARTLVATNRAGRWFFLIGFGKNQRDNVTTEELSAFKDLAGDLFQLDAAALEQHLIQKYLQEIQHEHR